jgi:hypothetical protein
VKPLDAALRNLHAYRASSPVSLIYGAHRFGQLGLPSLHDRIQAEKFNLLQRTQETGRLPAIAADNMLTRVVQNLAIPYIAQSPVTLGCLVPGDMKNLRLYASSVAQYVSDRGCSLHKNGKGECDPLNVRVPRPMNGSHSMGAPGWLRKFDIQTVTDLTTGVPGNPTAVLDRAGGASLWLSLTAAVAKRAGQISKQEISLSFKYQRKNNAHPENKPQERPLL